MTYSPRDAVRYLAMTARIELRDDEVTTLLEESGEYIDRMGRAVRSAAQEYEAFVIKLAAEMVARRSATPTTEHEAPMNGIQRSN